MAPIRLRHPGGVATIQVDMEKSTVQDLQQEIYTVSKILPSMQDLKSGYPPRPLTIVPELLLASLGLRAGDQIIVGQKPGVPQPSSPAPKASQTATQTAARGASDVSSNPVTSTPRSNNIEPDAVRAEGGFLIHRIVPDDNSCLFSSIALIFEQDIGKASAIRQIVADGIRKDMVTYSEAILGCALPSSRPRDEYIATILKPASWGGAIELSVLSAHYKTEISSIDVETGRVDRFEPSSGNESGSRCILIYSGIHYDAATLSPIKDAPADFHQTVFPIMTAEKSDPMLVAGQRLADILRKKKAFTNTATFDLKCEDCGQGLVGEKGAQAHAQETGHVRFGEYTN
ncbi:OTU-domain-containing protein [Athelia psychrophila]|uniref:Ubiquitin thioesterase OTU n=1 Tax=Athelia psychrophila TaxID=1759441 RepID=A0A166I8N7_9AGAM|nr:OTU-domain-containing protein [Fibularhizoctonia sp. CBS 109695]